MHIFMYKNCSPKLDEADLEQARHATSSLSWRYTAASSRPNVQPMVLQNSGSKLSNPSHIYETYRNKDFVKLQTIFPSNIRECLCSFLLQSHSYSRINSYSRIHSYSRIYFYSSIHSYSRIHSNSR